MIYSELAKAKVLTITNFAFQKYSKPVNYSTTRYVITKNYIAAVNNAEIIKELRSTDRRDNQRRFFFLMVWQKKAFESDLPQNLPLIEFTKPKIYQELLTKRVKTGSGYTYRLEKFSNRIGTSHMIGIEYGLNNEDPRSTDVISFMTEEKYLRTVQLKRSAKIFKNKN